MAVLIQKQLLIRGMLGCATLLNIAMIHSTSALVAQLDRAAAS